VADAGRFYRAEDHARGTHLALRWNGRLRFTVPREAVAQEACWRVFRPVRLVPLRAMVRLPRLLGSVNCVEDVKLASIREAIGIPTGLSCCRTGAPGVWSKDTILLLDKTDKPLYIVKAGVGQAVDLLLSNEAEWLRGLRDRASLADHIPELVTHRSGADLCFVVQCVLPGNLDYLLGELQLGFLRKLQEYSHQTMPLEQSRLYQDMRSRLKDLRGLLSEAWSTRLEKGMRRIEQTLSGPPILLVAAHNDFTPWNIRVEQGAVRVFDWEYAAYEQLPLFDPLHFILMPMALRNRPTSKMVRSMRNTPQLCQELLGKEPCYEPDTQALAYLMNICTLYLWSVRGESDSNPVLNSYARIIDYIYRQ
jgi:Phosphotransferase enzyme family